MRRRGLLAAGGAAGALAAAALGWPGWLRRAFADGLATRATIEPEPPGGQPQPGAMRRPSRSLPDAADQARAEGKKLLIFVIPTDPWQRNQRGHAIGEFLNHGTDADLAPLASAEVACALVSDVNERFGGAIEGQPLMILVEPGRSRAQVAAFDAPLPQITWGKRGEPSEDELIAERIKLLAGLAKKALGAPPEAEIEQRARKVRDTIVKKPPQGGQWGLANGCGVDYEDGPEVAEAVDCGLGHVPKKSARFLHFLVASAARP